MTKFRVNNAEPHAVAYLISGFCIVAVFASLLLRLSYIQLWKGETFRNLSENNRVRLVKIPASRGKIMDSHGENLVDNRPCFDVHAIPEEIQDYSSLQKILAPISPLPPDRLENRIEILKRAIPFRSYPLWKDAPWESMAFLEANRLRIPGVVIQVNQARDYLSGDLMAHAIGYLGEINPGELARDHEKSYRSGDLVGRVGIENEWEKELRGKNGGLQVEVDARGRQISVLGRKDPVQGKNVLLCLDRLIQEQARDAFGDQTGVAVAADPRDGSILCYVNLPSYDPNSFVGGIETSEWDKLRTDPLHPLQNKAIQGIYPPGSVFKIVTAIAALEEKVVTPEEKIFCGGSYRLAAWTFRCWNRYGHGWVDLHQAIVESCDVYFYHVGHRLGIGKIQTYAHKFGLGERTQISLGGEHPGLVPSPAWKKKRFKAPWYDGETLNVSIGQGYLLTTPVQVLMMISAVANGETLWKPRLVDRIEFPDGRISYLNAKKKNSSLSISSNTLAIVQKALRDVVHSAKGTGRRAYLDFTEVAGKTGTAQVVRQEAYQDPKNIPREERDHAWFACYAPVFAPEIAIVVLVEHGGHGGDVAAPIAKKIMEAYFIQKKQRDPGDPRDPNT